MAVPNYRQSREGMVMRYLKRGYLRTPRLAESMRRVPRELFVKPSFSHLAYSDRPIPIPHSKGDWTPQAYQHSLFYEALDLQEGDSFLEVGTGSGYGAALAWEMVGSRGRVVSLELDEEAYSFAKMCLARAGYPEVIVVNTNGYAGYSELAPYDKICVTASSESIPSELMQQLKKPGRLVAPLGAKAGLRGQDLILFKKDMEGEVTEKKLGTVICSPLITSEGK
jgi:protein-L-isoaspartate(D-aspartate) O-methyltransferase